MHELKKTHDKQIRGHKSRNEDKHQTSTDMIFHHIPFQSTKTHS